MRTWFLVLAVGLISSGRLVAQRPSARLRPSVSVGGIGPAIVLSEGSGVEVRSGTGVYVGAEATRHWLREDVALGLYGRVSVAGVRVTVGDVSYATDHVTQAVLGVRLANQVSRVVSLRGGIGAAFVHGPADVQPYASGSHVHPAIDIGIGFDLGVRSRWSFDLGGGGYLVSRSNGVNKLGIVTGPLIGLRRAL